MKFGCKNFAMIMQPNETNKHINLKQNKWASEYFASAVIIGLFIYISCEK